MAQTKTNVQENVTVKDGGINVQGDHNTVIVKLANAVDEVLQSDSFEVDREIPLGMLYQLNCDRTTIAARFHEIIADIEDEIQKSNLFCFVIHGEPIQQPRSLTERLIYELMDCTEPLNEWDFQVHYPKIDDQIDIKNLKPGDNIRAIKRRLPEFLKVKASKIDQLDDFYEKESSLKLNDFIAIPFEIISSDWDATKVEFLKWWAQTFCNNSQDKRPKFLVFLNILLDEDATNAKRDEIANDLKHLEACANNLIVFKELSSVPIKELQAWFREYIKNENKVNQIIEKIISALDEEGQKQNDFPMSFIENILERVVKHQQPKIG